MKGELIPHQSPLPARNLPPIPHQTGVLSCPLQLTSVLRHPSPPPSHLSHSGSGALGRTGRRVTVSRGQKTLVLRSDEDEKFPAILSLSLEESSTGLGLFFYLLQLPQMGRALGPGEHRDPNLFLFTPDPALSHPAQQRCQFGTEPHTV